MSSLLLLTNALQPSTEVLPALGLLLHGVRVAPAEGPALVDTPGADVILIDGRRDLPHVRSLCQLLRSTGPGCPLLLVVTEGGLAAVTADWGVDDVLLDTAGPAEVEARLRLAMGRQQIVSDDSPMEIRNGDLSVDEATYSAKLKGRVLDLTFKEFELLKYLAQHPGRVFTRAQLLQEVWGYDYFGGTRTVDVHVRRLRAKLGPEHESLIGTVRNVGYRFVVPEKVERAAERAAERSSEGTKAAASGQDGTDGVGGAGGARGAKGTNPRDAVDGRSRAADGAKAGVARRVNG
ncbi:response regulator transcription factor [Streptomyces sp. 71268]|uniref:response regulator transcription factor n=1 Tax=Streptomyces sp. 71268 TaxID=3002640 RepID=UPI0023F65D02|nr:response regulator transcription factor [Streptomyces sp. 71268]WEV27043.1 response regulator transcription factor [Streptomyces sp. 71268]